MDGGFPDLTEAKALAALESSSRRKRRRVRDQLNECKAPTDAPVIKVIAGELHITATASEDALLASGLPIFQRGDGLVQPVTREVPASRGRMALAAGLGEMNVYSLIDAMCATAEYEKFDARSEEWTRMNPPANVAQIVLSRVGKWRFPVIAGIITTPTLRPDGTLLTAPGYDAATRLYHVADPSLRLHPEVHSPNRGSAERALKVLLDLLGEFVFVKTAESGKPDLEISKAVALSALITPTVRGAMSVAPLTAVNAHAPGSGKTFLIDLVSLITTGRPCPVITAAPDEAETEKRIAGLLLAGYPIVSIDNCNGELGGDLLCQAIERPLIRIRRLGGSDITEIESSVTMFATGNNLRVRGDMVRRSLVAELDPQVERPELREFKHDPVAAILADRGKYVSACLIIVRAYILAGSPGKMSAIASFEGWSDLVRSALVWLGCADPALSMEAAREDDPELSELREVLSVWFGALKSDGFTTKEVADKIHKRLPTKMGEPTDFEHPELRDVLLRVAGTQGVLNTRRLGLWLLSKSGRIVSNQRFVKAGKVSGGALRWAVETKARKREE
jgi:putative DNA primase/helicase